MSTLAQRLAEPDVAALSDAEAAAALNAPDVANGLKRVPIPRKEAWTALLPRGAFPRLKRIAEDKFSVSTAVPDATTLIEAALGAIAQLERADTTVIDATSDLDWANLQQVLGLFVLNGALTLVDNDHVAAVLALGQAPRSWAEVNGFPSGVTADDVFVARGRPRLVVQE